MALQNDHPSSSNSTPNPATTANISIREYIYFLPYPLPPNTPVPYTINLPASNPLNLPSHPFEPTSTLVLTSPHSTFIDLRFLKPTSPTQPPLPNHGESARLEWGFAGHSTSRPISDPHAPSASAGWTTGKVSHSTWTHWVDSRCPIGTEAAVDEGTMYTISDTRALEHGHAWHPHLNAVSSHEEMWTDDPVEACGEGKTKKCVVLRCEDQKAGVRGVVFRLGRWVQGLLVVGDRVTAERWGWEEEGWWKRVARTGDGMVPCAVAWREEVLGVGGKVGYEGLEWDVEEVWEW